MRLPAFFVKLIFGAVCLLMGTALAQSPTTGQITGIVKDPSGAVVSDARITLTSAAGVQRETTSDGAGHFAFALLPPGNYRVEAEKAGFSAASLEGAVVRITETTSLEIRVAVAASASRTILVCSSRKNVATTSILQALALIFPFSPITCSWRQLTPVKGLPALKPGRLAEA